MRVFRALFIAILAASLAIPPLAMAQAHGSMAAGHSEHAAGAAPDCCPQTQNCDKSKKSDCDTQCALKCLSLSAAVLPQWDSVPLLANSGTVTFVSQGAVHRSINPLLPPPRL
jgi:hypothetical protein